MLQPGTRIASYEITGSLGAGGMGEVYRARDTHLGRDVAIKVLPQLFASDADRVERFEREARVLASLNHQNIAHVYGVERAAGTYALVMELVEGEDLSQRIARGPVPVDETIPIARQIADALEAAHDAGIVHRDLKPANIKVRADGVVKVLDFGLAKALERSPHTDIGNSPTFTSPAVTAVGTIVGTAAYMAPEQAKGKAADARSDMWAFGAILYEMLCGKPMFEGATVSELLAAVLRDEPKWQSLPSDTPAGVRRLLRRCLQKDPQLRLRHAGDARLELTDDYSRADEHTTARPVAFNLRMAALLAIPVALVVGAIAYFIGARTRSTAELPLRKWTVPLEYGETDAIWFRENAPAISPDGQRVAYVDGPKLRIRSLGALDDRDIAAAGVPAWPTWSADGSALAYVTDHRALWKVPITEGPPAKICDLPQGAVLGVAWRRDKTILVNVAYGPHGAEIFSVPDTGGTPQRRAIPGVPEGKTPIVFDLHGLPDGSIAYTKAGASGLTTILEREGQEPRTLAIPANWGVVYSPSGHLLFARRDAPGIFAVVFEAGTATVVGQPFRIIENGLSPSVSADGTLAYLRGVPGSRQLAWLDRSGNVISAIGQAQDSMWDPSISPDGTRVAVAGVEQGTPEIWTHDTARNAKSRLTISGIALGPAWHPTERRIVFQTVAWDLSSVSADGGDPASIVQSPDPEFNPRWSRDGKYLLFGRNVQKTGADLWVLEQGAKDPKLVLATTFNEFDATMSPDGTYIAYASDETGKLEVFVRTFPAAQDKTQISFATGHSPLWSPKGNEIFYVEGRRLMTATVKTSPKFSADPPKPLFDLEDRAGDVRVYDTADGQRFAVVRTLRPPRNGVVVVQNWIKEFAGR